MKERTETNWEDFYNCFIYSKDTGKLIVDMQEIYNDRKHLCSCTWQTAPYTDENKTQVNSKEPRSQGERRAGVAARLGTCTLEGGGAPSCGTCQWSCSSARSHTRGARVRGGTRAEQSPRAGISDPDPVEVGCPRSLSESTRRIAPPTKNGHAPPPTDS